MLAQTSASFEPFLASEIQTPYITSKAVILPIPYEATTTYRQGCHHGPDAILAASQQLENYDDELEREIATDVGIYTCPPLADTRQGQLVCSNEMLQITSQKVTQLLNDKKFVIALGGEHSITAGVVDAYRTAYNEPFTVVQIDAHADLRHEYEGSIHNHACVMRRVVEMGLPTLPIGIRSLSQEEANLIKEKSIPIFWAREMAQQTDWIKQALGKITTRKIFITIDLDGIDPTLIPGVGTPEPGGLNWYALTNFLRQVFINYQVIGCDVMELAPVNDSVVSQYTAAKLVYKLIGYQALAQGW